MNRFQLVQVVIIAVALCLGYQAIFSFCWFINQVVSSFENNYSLTSRYAVFNGINALLFSIAFFWILNKTTLLANWVLSKTDLDPNVQLNISVTSFLLGVIVFWGLKAVFESGADIITYAIASFYTTTSSKTNRYEGEGTSIISSFVKLIAGILLLRYAKPLSQYFEKQTDENDPHQIEGNSSDNENLT